MGFISVKGNFNTFSGSLYMDAHGKLKTISSQIRTASIDTNNKKRDAILISEAYLNAVTYPYIVFNSLRSEDDNFIEGLLKIGNVERKINLPIRYGKSKGTGEKYLKFNTLLKRSDFNIDFGPMNALVGNEILVEIEIHKK